MRTAFIETLCNRAEADADLWLLTADLGFSVLEPFADRFSDRYINVGVAEQNMMGVAAGLAACGRRVVTYSIVNFATLRCLEQIRNDICYHGANVLIVGVGAGYAYGAQGYTHHGLEDLAIMRTLPNLQVVVPADPLETRLATEMLLQHDGPGYLRLGKAGEQVLHEQPPAIAPGRMIPCRRGEAAAIVATGSLLAEALSAAGRLAQAGHSVAVWSCPWLAPFDRDTARDLARQYPVVVSLEEGVPGGGLAAALAHEIAATDGSRARLLALGANADGPGATLSQATARARHGLDAAGIVDRLLPTLDRGRG